MMTPLSFVIIPAIVLAAEAQPSGEYRSELSTGGVSLLYRVIPTDLTVAQRIRVELTVTVPPGWSVSWPAVGEKLGRAAVVETADARDANKHTRTFTLEPYLPGDDTVPALSVSASPRDPQTTAEPVTLTTESVPLTIKALLAETDADKPVDAQFRDARDDSGSKSGTPAWLIGAVGVSAMLATGIVLASRRRVALPDLSRAALAKVDALAAAKPPATAADRNAALDQTAHAAREFLQARAVRNAIGTATTDLGARITSVPSLAPAAARITELLATIDSARFDPRHEGVAPGTIAAELAAVLRSTLAPVGQEARA